MTLEKPLVSFIIPYFNSGNTIQETLDSIFNQSYNNFDIWIINDGSTDTFSVNKLKDFEGNDKIHILHQNNSGPSVARNLAINKTQANYFVPLDADDVIEQNALELALAQIQNNEKIGAIYGHYEWFGSRHGLKVQHKFLLEKQFIMNQIPITAMIRKEMWEEIGGYDTFLSKPGLEDWEFWLKAGLSHWRLQLCDTTFFKVRVNEASRTFEVANKNLDLIKKYVFEKHSLALAKAYETIWYQKKQLAETPDYRIGNFLMSPYRLLKKFFL
jgi:glycosyltransferase involved in cell wall biosynthesis